MKKLMKLALVCAAAMTAITFTACDKGAPDPEPTCKVTFNSQGGSAVTTQTVDKGAKATRPENPTREGYYFLNWFKEAACTNVWNFTADAVNSDITLYAGWTQIATYTVTFHTNGGSAIDPQQVVEGGHATQPVPPTLPPLAFGGWFTDNGTFANAFDFTGTAITANVDLYAKWTGVDKEALQTLIDEAQGLNSGNYTSGSYEAVYEAATAAMDVVNDPEAADAEIIEVYLALNAAMEALVALPHRAVVAISHWPVLVDGFVSLTPGQMFDLNANAVDTDGNPATNNSVVFQIDAPAWMEDVGSAATNFHAQISGSAPVGATVPMTILSEENPDISLLVTLKVVAVGELKAQFIAAVAGLPEPTDIAYAHGGAVGEALDIYYMLTWEEQEEAEVVSAYEKLEACQEALWNLPERYTYSFSGNTATISYLNYDDSPEDPLITTYALNGSFPNGTYTEEEWTEGDPGSFYQSRLTLESDATFKLYYRGASDQNGADATDWEQEEQGTYTITGTQVAGGMLYLTFEEGPEPEPVVEAAVKPASARKPGSASVSSLMHRR